MSGHELDELARHFEVKLTNLSQAVHLYSGMGNHDFHELCLDVERSIDSSHEKLNLLKMEIERQKQMLLKFNDLKKTCDRFSGHLRHALDNIPELLPSITKPPTTSAPQKVEETFVMTRSEMEKKTVCDEYIHLITVQDFESVPKYMKGRMLYSKVTNIIVKLNEAFAEKYKVLKLKKSSLNDKQRKMVAEFRNQENKDTRGVHFIVDKDIEQFTSLKMDNTTRNVLVMLRHCGVMHEIRGGGYVRYSSYS